MAIPLINPSLDKRIVFLATTGPYTAIPQIVGTLSQLGPQMTVASLPGVLPATVDGVEVQVSLLKVTPRAVYYRQGVAAITGKFNDTFNPAQV